MLRVALQRVIVNQANVNLRAVQGEIVVRRAEINSVRDPFKNYIL